MADPSNPYQTLERTDAQWKERLTPEQYNILRDEGTEPKKSSSLNDEWRDGIYHCAGCDLPLFTSDKKYESHTGWPSFTDPIDGHIVKKLDKGFFMTRVEYHCAKCDGHQGHIFDDGPEPTGKRYCNNGLALTFKAQDKESTT